MKKIAIYGKGGIGKSTTASNIAASMSAMGLKVMQIGCDPKADSTQMHTDGQEIKTVLDQLRSKEKDITLEDMVKKGNDGVMCVECGGPIPGTGCAGRGIITAVEELKKLGALSEYKPDVVLYDVLGDVVCGGFAMPLRADYSRNVFIVTSGEKMSLYAAANIALALEHFKGRGYAQLSGIIQNSRDIENEDKLVEEFADENGVPIVGVIPREELITNAEGLQKTLVEAFPDSSTAGLYEDLAKRILDLSEDVENDGM